MKKFIVSIIFLISFPLSAKTKVIEYEKINIILTFYQENVKSDYVTLVQKVDYESIGEVEAWVVNADKKEPLLIADTGEINLPLLDEIAAKNSRLVFNKPSDSISLILKLNVTPPKRVNVGYNEMLAVLDDLNQFRDKLSGSLSWLVPSYDELCFSFDQEAFIDIHYQNERVRYPSTSNKILIEFGEEFREKAVTLQFSLLPIAVEPECD